MIHDFIDGGRPPIGYERLSGKKYVPFRQEMVQRKFEIAKTLMKGLKMKITAEERDFILRHRCEAKASREECFEKIEQHLFGDQFGQPEPNTDDENRLWSILQDFHQGIDKNTDDWELIGNDLSPTVMKAFRFLKDCQPYYQELLTPKDKTMYRGIALDSNKIVGYKPKKVVKHPAAPKQGMYVFDYTYRARKELQSWTTNPHVATLFAHEHIADYEPEDGEEPPPDYFNTSWNLEDLYGTTPKFYPAIIIAKTDKSFFGSPKLTTKLDGSETTPHGKVNEVYRLSKKPKKVQLLIPKKIFDYSFAKKTNFKKGDLVVYPSKDGYRFWAGVIAKVKPESYIIYPKYQEGDEFAINPTVMERPKDFQFHYWNGITPSFAALPVSGMKKYIGKTLKNDKSMIFETKLCGNCKRFDELKESCILYDKITAEDTEATNCNKYLPKNRR